VDLLLARAGVDPKRIILIGSVAGGGDPAAVAASLDNRITAAVPLISEALNRKVPTRFHPTRKRCLTTREVGHGNPRANLRLSCYEGFLPWVIVGAIAPRRLIYAHEFSWDREDDPVWKRLNTIFND
jgi:hypothetical protein